MNEIERYIASTQETLNVDAFKQLNTLYKHLQLTIPNATECISYGMPCFIVNNKPVVYFAGYKRHIGFYPTAKPIEYFKEQLVDYKTSKGAVQFNLVDPLPWSLIDRIIAYNLRQSNESL
ncbi:MAG: iron chaperone [Flavobacteriales bacterium]